MTDSGSPHGLLLRHFADWARGKSKNVDLDLLEELLHLRSSYDNLEPTYWPVDSVEHLLLEQWPSKGDVDVPDPDVLIETLDAYFRFLRNTGRMSGRSGEQLVTPPRCCLTSDARSGWTSTPPPMSRPCRRGSRRSRMRGTRNP